MKTWLKIILTFLGIFLLFLIKRIDLVFKDQPLNPFSIHQVEAGDVIFVKGNSWRSLLVLAREQQEVEYSHVGLIVPHRVDCSQWEVIHATPDLHGQKVNRVVREPLDSFLAGNEISTTGIFRLMDGSPVRLEKIISSAETFWKTLTPFDHDFDCGTIESVYCTELIWRAFRCGGIDLGGIESKELLLPSHLIMSPYLEKVGHYKIN